MAVKRLEDLTPLEKLALVDISYSRLSTYEMCKAKYFYNYVAKEETVFGEHAKLGNVLHSTLENVLEPGTPVEISNLMSEYETQSLQWDPDNKISMKLIEDGRGMLEDFADRHSGETFNILEKEKEFAIVVGGGLIRGFIDRVDVHEDTVYIVDYKSGRREVTYANVASDLQLGIYALAMSKEYPDKNIHASLYYLRSGRQKGHLFSTSDLEVVEDRLVNLIYELISSEVFEVTSNTRVCTFCDFATTGACRVGQRRKKDLGY